MNLTLILYHCWNRWNTYQPTIAYSHLIVLSLLYGTIIATGNWLGIVMSLWFMEHHMVRHLPISRISA